MEIMQRNVKIKDIQAIVPAAQAAWIQFVVFTHFYDDNDEPIEGKYSWHDHIFRVLAYGHVELTEWCDVPAVLVALEDSSGANWFLMDARYGGENGIAFLHIQEKKPANGTPWKGLNRENKYDADGADDFLGDFPMLPTTLEVKGCTYY